MEPQPLVSITKQSFTITPTVLDLALSHARFFIHEQQARLKRDRGSYRVQNTEEPTIILLDQISHAEALVRDVEPVKDQLQELYRWHFKQLAEVMRKTRLHLGHQQIEDSYTLKVVLFYLMEMLKAENVLFSRSAFVDHINH